MDTPPHFEAPLTDEELRVIGRITAQWVLLETLIDLLVLGQEHRQDQAVERVPAVMSFTQRLRLWERVAAQRLGGSELERMRALIRRTSDVLISREGLLDEGRRDLADRIRAWALAVNSGDVEHADFAGAKLDFEALERVADEIAGINAELLGFCRKLGEKFFPAA